MAISITDGFKYIRIADSFQQQIKDHLLRAGEKLPSIRTLSQELGVSVNSVYKAYMELENRGLIEARLKSGYYVKPPGLRSIISEERPGLAQFLPEDVSHNVKIVFDRLSDVGLQRLAIAGPADSLIPVQGLRKSMIEAMSASSSGNANYEDKEGNYALRKEIAKNLLKSGGLAKADDVITTHGCNEAILFCLKAITKPGDVVAIESPGYFGIFNILINLGLKVLEIPSDVKNGLDIDYLEAAIQTVKISACLFIPNFNNPTGISMPDSGKQRLVELISRNQVPLIEDDACGELYFGKTRPQTCKSFDKDGWVLLCSSITKTIAPGYRVGWCLPGRFREDFIRIKMVHAITSATPTQAAIARFFESGRYDRHMRLLRKSLSQQCLCYIKAISSLFPPGTKICTPAGGYSLWIELDHRINAFELYNEALTYKIAIAPGQIFSIDQRYTNYIRLSYGVPYDPTVERGLKTLGQLVERLTTNISRGY